ncbi:unnamed protein product [Phytophthora fragariaefolia]|uniref:Unnamed protein product n=1 Tax=Phytophthora fragariaefolia TaxID=1490495 RepID=A0A9W6XZ88_9STRA|nr:unnamed protein product [Phytophthora fragariaefolia]
MAPFATSIHHASRLQLYRDADRDLEESLVEQAIHGKGSSGRGSPFHPTEPLHSSLEILVKWYGLDELEASWEPADAIREHVPLLFEAFIAAEPADPERKQILDALAALTHRRAPAPSHQPRARSRGRPRIRVGHWESSH